MDIFTILLMYQNKENAKNQKKYLKNQFDFIGIKSPLLKSI